MDFFLGKKKEQHQERTYGSHEGRDHKGNRKSDKEIKTKESDMGRQGISIWIYCSKLKLLEIIQRIWRGEDFPKNWRKGIIVSIYKKGNEDKAAIMLQYTKYAMILEQRFR